jgi:serine/threonine-protein kinase RsbW
MTDPVTLTFPAHARNVALARSLAAAMSARADLPIDQLEDVRLAVDEAVSQLILSARPDAAVTCTFTVTTVGLDVVVSAPTTSVEPPPTDTFSWTVLRALVDSVTADVAEGTVTLALAVERHAAVDV